MSYTFDFASILAIRGVLLQGILATLWLAAGGILLSLALGIVFGAARSSKSSVLNGIALAYVELFRNIPVLVLMLWFYYAFPIATGIQVSAYTAAMLALGANSGAFTAEIIRASIAAVPRSQWEAARAIGMTPGQQLRRIIVPQALPIMLPGFANRWVELIKLTSLAAAIAFPELLYTARTIAAAYYNPIEAFTAAALLYIVILLPLTQSVLLLEHRIMARGRR